MYFFEDFEKHPRFTLFLERGNHTFIQLIGNVTKQKHNDQRSTPTKRVKERQNQTNKQTTTKGRESFETVY